MKQVPTVSKIYEKCVTQRIEKWMKERNIINEYRGSAQEHCISLQTAWMVKETIHANIDKGKVVYVGILDTKKAYDTV